MYGWSKVLAFALIVSLWGFGATALQAKDHKDRSCEPPGCPAPVLTTPTVESNCCPMDTVKTHCEPPVQCGCNPVDPKEISKAQKEALEKQHDAIKAQNKRQKAIAKAQQELEEKTAKEQRRIDKANDHFNHENAEFNDANARYESFFGGPAEAEAAVTPQPQPEQQAAVQPAPAPAPPVAVEQPTPAPQEEIAIATVTETPIQEPARPKQLPRTAGEMSLLGLIGMVSVTGGYLARFFRR